VNRSAVIAAILVLGLVAGLWIQHGARRGTGENAAKGGGSVVGYEVLEETPGQTERSRRARERALRATALLAEPVADPRQLPRPRIERGAVPGERALMFSSAADYHTFLEAAEAAGFRVLGTLDAFNAVRLGGVFDSGKLQALLDQLDVEPAENGANFAVGTPELPVPEERDPLDPRPFGNRVVEWLGLLEFDRSAWGQGVTIAVLDSGIAPIFSGKEIPNTLVHDGAAKPEGSAAMHGTAVSSIIVSEDPRIPGIAPAAELIGFSVINENGLGDSFTLASGIVAAVDAGADLINASLGSSGDSAVVREAVQYAEANGVLIIASAGNEQLSEVAYPARYPETLAVGAIDALGRQLEFSNSGEALGLGAPGQDIFAFGANGSPVSFSGTSASAPFVTAAVAAILSQEPGLSPRQAADLLLVHADEAGAPGPDRNYGVGNLNLARVLNRNEPGLRDLAVASHHVSRDANGQPVLQVIVENRGTAISQGGRLNVDLVGGARVAVLPPIQPNEIFLRDFPLAPSALSASEAIPVQSKVTLSDDLNTRNDSLTSEIGGQGAP